MVKPFSQLPRILDERSRQVVKAVDRIVEKGAGAAGKAAVLATRVDTGVARSNWVATKGSPNTQEIPAYAPGNLLGIGEQANARAAINQHRPVIRGYKSLRREKLFFTNVVDYIALLNSGSSLISPGNMLIKARQAFINAVKGEPVFKR